MKKENNYAYIDGANLYNGVRSSGFDLDYNKFRIWLKDKYQITKAYIFIGMVPEKNDLYLSLKDAGFILVYKEVIYDKIGLVKGNCDADLVLQTICDYYEKQYDRCIVVSSDGDFAPLIKFLLLKDKIITLVSPYDKQRCSILLKKINVSISYINEHKDKFSYKRKDPR
jgi:uncharacterized LabA/DUF88 family protein